ncbi:hypothetical protein ACN47E_003616 [Coniothyrium glycines]
MGIPIGWNIQREEAKDRDVLRADLTGQRSPIRRRARPTRSPTSQGAFDADLLLSAARSPRPGSASRSSHPRTRLAPPPVPEVSRTEYSRYTPGSILGQTRPSRQQLYARAPLDPPLGRPGDVEHAASDDGRQLPALTPGFAPAYGARRTAAEAHREARDRYIGYVPPPRLSRSRSPTHIVRYRSGRTGYSLDSTEDDQDSQESNAVSFPPLRRMGRRTIADGPLPSSSLRESWSPVSTVDGLGDRERSVSPLDEHLPWDTFLTTVVPDPVAPTAESSFASAAASASFSNSHHSSRAGSSNSATSSRTHLTIPSRRGSPPQNEQFMRACDTSEDDSASDTEEEEMDVRGSIRRSNATEVANSREPLRRRMRPSYFSNEPPVRDSRRYSHRVLEQSRDASAYVRSFYNSVTQEDSEVERPLLSQLDGPVEDTGSPDDDIPDLYPVESTPSDQELRDARSLLERLTRDPEVSDEFWASVGLTRSMTDPVERFQERERH